ncbi:MAG: hypothetical protein ACO25B_10020 [Chitinophagaceae bacterium]
MHDTPEQLQWVQEEIKQVSLLIRRKNLMQKLNASTTVQLHKNEESYKLI